MEKRYARMSLMVYMRKMRVMAKKRILILGGNGFIGRNIARCFSRDDRFEVRTFDRTKSSDTLEGVTGIVGDFFSEESLFTAVDDCDCVIHALSTITPGNSNERYLSGYENDLMQTIKLCDRLRDAGKDLLFLSSGGTVYGDQEQQPISEEAQLRPINHYAGLKVAIENVLRIHNQQFNTKFKIARVANPYGPGQDHTKGVGFVDAVIRCGLKEKPLTLFGDGETVRDYIHIDDVCTLLKAILRYEGPLDVFNIATGTGVSQNEVLALARSVFPALEVAYQAKRSIDLEKVILDPSRVLALDEAVKPREFKTGFFEYCDYLKELSS